MENAMNIDDLGDAYLSVNCIEYLGSLGIACHATMQQLQHRIGWDVFWDH